MRKTEKQKLREAMRKLRDQIPVEVRSAADEVIAGHLRREDWYVQAEDILIYAAIHSEVGLAPFMRLAHQDGKHLYFPKVQGENMDFYRIEEREQLAMGAFHVMEPVTRSGGGGREAGCLWKETANTALTPILVPGLAFSRDGARMGYGRGYYDRYLAAHESLLPVGICYEAQMTQKVPSEPHDYKMKRIITERESYTVTVDES